MLQMPNDPLKQDATVPDFIVSVRQFVGGLNAALNDQTYAGADAVVVNPTGGFTTVGPYGSAVEGRPIAITSTGGVSISPSLMLILMGAAAVMLLRKG